MKKILFVCLISFAISQDFPGGYIGLSVNYGTQNTIGFQVSIGTVMRSIGEPGMGPYLMPGIAGGMRYSISEKRKYYYADTQILFQASGFWAGVGKGITLKDGEKFKRSKLFGGFLSFGGIREQMKYSNKFNPNTGEKNNKRTFYNGFHCGIAIPLIGSHFYP